MLLTIRLFRVGEKRGVSEFLECERCIVYVRDDPYTPHDINTEAACGNCVARIGF